MKKAFSGVSNPYVIAELISGKKIRWDSLSNRDQVLEDILQIPQDDIFNPRLNPILNPLLKINTKGEVKIMQEDEAKIHFQKKISSFKLPPPINAAPSSLFSRLPPSNSKNYQSVRNKLSLIMEEDVENFYLKSSDTPWEPADKKWIDKGDFYEDLGEYNDPIQGALGDCYFIAALASVAWSRPYVIANRVRASLLGDDHSPIHLVEFYKDGRGASVKIEVSEKVPVTKSGYNWVYARSLDAGEIWPAVMEKAYAKWKTQNSTDMPAYAPISGGDPVRACAEIMKGSKNYTTNSDKTEDQIWQYVRGNSRGGKTFNPMVAWTFSQQPSGLNYNSANIVASHAYSVLGWDYVNGKKYIIVRNPWGTKHATLDTKHGSSRGIPLDVNGVFCIRAKTFKQYFSGIGHSE